MRNFDEVQATPLVYWPSDGSLMPVVWHADGGGVARNRTAAEYREYYPESVWRYNPWTGLARYAEHIDSDPYGATIVCKATATQPLQVPKTLAAACGLPTDAKARKAIPLYTGLFKYFPDALCAVAELSRIGNEQHNPGQPLHWDNSKSMDHADCLLRHQMDVGTVDTDTVRHATKVAWRALAQLQIEIVGSK